MSRATFEALDAAIRAHLADENIGTDYAGGYVSAWMVATASVMPEEPNRHSYAYMTPDQPLHTTLGLLAMAHRWGLSEADASFGEPE